MNQVSLGTRWVRKPSGHSAVVFIHGILSSSESAWTHENGANWPNMLAGEHGSGDLGVCVFSYRSDALARTYSLSDAVDSFRESANLDGLWDMECVVFVCHSMGGIIARRFLVANQQRLFQRKPKIGLFLIASPSLGSEDANRFHFLARMLESTQASALRFSKQNVWLSDLDKDFVNLKDTSGLIIRGKELVEDEPIPVKSPLGFVRRLFGLKEQVVQPFSAARYFPQSIKIAYSDHNSIAKPEGRESLQHRLLKRFVEETLTLYPVYRENTKPEANRAANALSKLKERLVEGKLIEYGALAAIEEALLETRSYLERRAEGQDRDTETENLLSEVWSKAGTAILPYDSELANLCFVKGHGWADNDLWENPKYKQLPISVDEMLEKILDATRKASSSAKRMETRSNLDIVEGTLKVDTLTWRTTVLLPPFSAPPEVTVVRPDGHAAKDPIIEGVTPDKFTVCIDNTDQQGEWVWRARGTLLGSRPAAAASS